MAGGATIRLLDPALQETPSSNLTICLCRASPSIPPMQHLHRLHSIALHHLPLFTSANEVGLVALTAVIPACLWELRRAGAHKRLPSFSLAAFVEFDDPRDADDAIRKLDGFNGWRVELSRGPRGGGSRDDRSFGRGRR